MGEANANLEPQEANLKPKETVQKILHPISRKVYLGQSRQIAAQRVAHWPRAILTALKIGKPAVLCNRRTPFGVYISAILRRRFDEAESISS
jgi:hypothetical protein